MGTNHLIIYLRGSITEYEETAHDLFSNIFTKNSLTNQDNGGREVA